MIDSIYSLILNSNIFFKIHIVIEQFELGDYDKNLNITKLFQNVEIYFYNIGDKNIRSYDISKWRCSDSANVRLFFQEILKERFENIDKLLYLDTDILAICSLLELDKYNKFINMMKEHCLNSYYKQLYNLDTYYNSGVILFNISIKLICHD